MCDASNRNLSEGLKREFKVVVPAADLDAKVDARLDELKDQVRINGFRPGKVPVDAPQAPVWPLGDGRDDRGRGARGQRPDRHRARLQARRASRRSRCRPKKGAVEQVIEGKTDLAYTVAIEILPPIELADFKGIKLERLTAEVTDAEVDKAFERIAEQNRPFCRRPRARRRPRATA